MEGYILEAVDVCKEIEGKKILNEINFKCKNKTVMAVRGQNGSGKSTLLKMMAGIYKPTRGEVKIRKMKIGYVPEHFPENLRFKLKEYLLLTASFQGFPKQQVEADLSEYIRMFGLEPYVDTPLKKCSKGTKQKAGFIQALMMKPDLLILDEPLTGLDSASKEKLIMLLEKLKRQITIIFTAHEEELIEKLADTVFIIETGEYLNYIKNNQAQKLIKVKFINKEIFKELEFIEVHFDGNTALLTSDSSKSDELLLKLLHKNCSILEVQEKRQV